MYEKLLKELKKGNAVLLEVVCRRNPGRDRIRVVTPVDCFFDEYRFYGSTQKMTTSCFTTDALGFPNIKTPKELVESMKAYDKKMNQKISKMQVL